MKTWKIEALVVGAALLYSVSLTKGRAADWVAAIAVLFSFFHCQVSFRLMEKERNRSQAEVECFAWLTVYHVLKELCWTACFFLLSSWPSLVGVAIFLLYPIWRRHHTNGRRAVLEPVEVIVSPSLAHRAGEIKRDLTEALGADGFRLRIASTIFATPPKGPTETPKES